MNSTLLYLRVSVQHCACDRVGRVVQGPCRPLGPRDPGRARLGLRRRLQARYNHSTHIHMYTKSIHLSHAHYLYACARVLEVQPARYTCPLWATSFRFDGQATHLCLSILCTWWQPFSFDQATHVLVFSVYVIGAEPVSADAPASNGVKRKADKADKPEKASTTRSRAK